MKDLYPQVQSLEFDLTFSGEDIVSPPPSRNLEKYVTDSCAFFEFDCSYRDCIDGGFDLTGVVTDMVEKGKTECSGDLFCQGRQEGRRNLCFHRLTYKIVVKYKNDD